MYYTVDRPLACIASQAIDYTYVSSTFLIVAFDPLTTFLGNFYDQEFYNFLDHMWQCSRANMISQNVRISRDFSFVGIVIYGIRISDHQKHYHGDLYIPSGPVNTYPLDELSQYHLYRPSNRKVTKLRVDLY